ncbi:unnamed protein product [Periconia digitata]|uniref:Uncharacterized protein n=1 Tax=Periconia digitata TaxID=1303443 RepID=A0A9W4XQJ7_9PLEO|nr:unnamed protein product [Periconia digitata]
MALQVFLLVDRRPDTCCPNLHPRGMCPDALPCPSSLSLDETVSALSRCLTMSVLQQHIKSHANSKRRRAQHEYESIAAQGAPIAADAVPRAGGPRRCFCRRIHQPPSIVAVKPASMPLFHFLIPSNSMLCAVSLSYTMAMVAASRHAVVHHP